VQSSEAGTAVDLQEVERALRDWLSGAERVVLLGIGSPLSGDDAVGAEIVRKLEGKTSNQVLPLVCWTVPESCTGPIRRFAPTNVLMIDAAELRRVPGSSQLIAAGDVLGLSLSTHSMPLRLLAEYLTKTTGAEIALLAVQPKETALGEGLSEDLQRAAQKLADMLLRVLPDRGDCQRTPSAKRTNR